MAESKSFASGGIGFGGLLAVAFVVLKLTHVIDWSWWWVLSPIWIPASIGVTIVGALFLWALVVTRNERRERPAKAVPPEPRPRNPWVD